MPRRDTNSTFARDSENVPVLNELTCRNPEIRVEDSSPYLRVRAPLLDESTNVTERVPRPNNRHDITVGTRDTSCTPWPVHAVPEPPASNAVFQAMSVETAAFADAMASPDLSTIESTGDFPEESPDVANSSSELTSVRCEERRRTTHVLSSGLVIEVESTGTSGLTESLDAFNSHNNSRTASPEPTHGDNLHDDGSLSVRDKSPSYAYPFCDDWDTYPPRQRDDYCFESSQDIQSQLDNFCCGVPDSVARYQIETTTRIASPDPLRDDFFHLKSDDSAIHSPSECDNFPPGQGGHYYFGRQMEDLQPHLEPFYCGDPWRLKFIPTVLMFLGTRSDPWECLGDSFVSLLRDVWTTVYGDTVWPDDDGDLVCSLVTDSVTVWFESFASNALIALEFYLKRTTDGFPSFSEWSVLCKEIVHDGRLFYEYPDGPKSPGIYGSPFVLAPLSGHLQAIRGGMEVQGVAGYDLKNETAYPYGAIGLAAAAASRAALLFGMELVAYDEENSLFVKTTSSDGPQLPTIDTSFGQSAAGGMTRKVAAWARTLQDHEWRAILSRANAVSLELQPAETKTEQKTFKTSQEK